MSCRVESWDIVFWHKENSCDFVPSIWAVDSTKTIYLFPVNVTRKTLTHLIHTCEDPSSSKNIKYREHRATYKKTVTSLEVAEKLIQKAVDTDNFENGSDEDVEDILANSFENDKGDTGIYFI